MTTGKTIALTRWTFVGKVMSLLFNMLSRLVITFLPRSKQASSNFMAAVTVCSDFEPKKINSVTVSIVSPSLCHKVIGPDAMILLFWMLSSQEAGQVVWYSHLFKNFPQFVVIHTVKGFGIVNKVEVNISLKLLLFRWSSRCWQFVLWSLCPF